MRSTSRAVVAGAAVALLVGGPLQSAMATGHTSRHNGGGPGTGPSVTVVASNLDNPRGLTWAHGHLYVAQAGHGGTDCPKGAVGPEGGPLCFGLTSSLAVIKNGHAQKVIDNLISMSDLPGGLAAIGLEAVAKAPEGLRGVFGESVVGVLTGLPDRGASLTPAISDALRHQLGQLYSVHPWDFTPHFVADVGDADFSWTAINQDLVPDQYPDANPNALLAEGGRTLVVDAGANSLVSVNRRGVVRHLAFFPNPPAADAVPTCVAKAPDGDLVVGQLSPGAPLNGSNIYRVDPRTYAVSVWMTGFNVVDGCGFDKWGNFYAVEFQSHGFNPGPTGNPAGDVVKVAPNGTRTVLGAGMLNFPQGFAIDNHGAIYVSNWSIMTATGAGPGAPTGQIVRITQ